MEPMLSPLWWGLVLLRLLWALLPQSGYIHPDEFFQTTEVIAGDVLSIDSQRPWEYNASFPLRSIVLPSVVCHPGYQLLAYLHGDGIHSNTLDPSTYSLLVAPRITVAVLSIVVDYLLGKTAGNFGIGRRSTLLCYASSYVTLVHLTRTFTNTFEAFLCVVLLYICSRSSPWTRNKAMTSSKDACALCLVLVAGVFNRPTFVVFAVVPLIYWFLWWYQRSFPRKLLECAQFCLTFSAMFILADTVYYRSIPPSEIISDLLNTSDPWHDWPRILVITPYNFLLYNLNPQHLASHGVHSQFTHAFVNLPMLFGPCTVLTFWILAVAVFTRRSQGEQEQRRNFLLQMIFVPVLCLSKFIHQEARFLVPILAPIALLCGTTVFGRRFQWRVLKTIWIAFNILGALVFGVLHQGGVVPSIKFMQSHLNKKITSQELSTNHVLFYHTYMPPVHLFGKPTLDNNNSITDLIHIHDLKGAPYSELESKIQDLRTEDEATITLILPAPVAVELCTKTKLKFQKLYSAWPHVSFEDPPDIYASVTGTVAYEAQCVTSSIPGVWDNVRDAFSLHVVQVHRE